MSDLMKDPHYIYGAKYVDTIEDKHREIIDDALDWLDVSRIAKVMEFLDWRWYIANNEVPDERDIRRQARRLLEEAMRSAYKNPDKPIVRATGGLEASAEWVSKKDGIDVRIQFVLSQGEAWSECLDNDGKEEL